MEDYEKHVILINNQTLCGIDARHLWVFKDINHWILNHIDRGRLLGCPECLKKLKEYVDSAFFYEQLSVLW